MISLDKNGNIITKSNYVPHNAECDVVDRMHALIGLVRSQEPACYDHKNTSIALEMLEELLPNKEQVKTYIHKH